MASPGPRPSLGRIVHFVDNYLVQTHMAFIATEPRMENGVEVVDLAVVRPGFTDLYPVSNAPMGAPGTVGHWWWPARVPEKKEESAAA